MMLQPAHSQTDIKMCKTTPGQHQHLQSQMSSTKRRVQKATQGIAPSRMCTAASKLQQATYWAGHCQVQIAPPRAHSGLLASHNSNLSYQT